jgi:hypothetical protein
MCAIAGKIVGNGVPRLSTNQVGAFRLLRLVVPGQKDLTGGRLRLSEAPDPSVKAKNIFWVALFLFESRKGVVLM